MRVNVHEPRRQIKTLGIDRLSGIARRNIFLHRGDFVITHRYVANFVNIVLRVQHRCALDQQVVFLLREKRERE